MGMVIRFLFHCLAIYLGTRAARVEADLGRVLITTLVGYLAMWLVGLVLYPLHWIPLLNLFVGSAVVVIGTAAAAMLVMGCKLREAVIIAAVAGVIQFVAGLLLSRMFAF